MPEHDETRMWIQRARAGDELALSKLLTVYDPILRARARQRLDPALLATTAPEDILQQVYLQVFQDIGRFEDREPRAFLNWICTLLDHRLIDAARAAHRRVRDVARNLPMQAGSYWNLLDHLQDHGTTPSRVIRCAEAVDALELCVPKLSEIHRRVIELRYLEGLPVAEVAARLDKSEDAVVALSRRALQALRRILDTLGEFTTGP